MMVKLKIKSSALAALASANAAPPPPSTPATPAATAPPNGKPKKQKAFRDPNKTPKEPKELKEPKEHKEKNSKPPAGGESTKPKKQKESKKPKTTVTIPTPAAAAIPVPVTPITPTVFPKIKLKTSALNSPIPPTPIAEKQARPKLKLTSSSFNVAAPNGPASGTTQTPTIKLRTKQKPTNRKRTHIPGNGYDSEASDREDDPAIEEQFILRMPPGPDCDYLRGVIERKELNVTSDVWMKFKDQRRAVVYVRGHLYAANLVDLPCIIEANKTLDKKNIFKTADICQMLLVGDRIQSEADVLVPGARAPDPAYPHGITPPMQYVRKRRFRKRISNRTIEAVEAEVDRLLREDEQAMISTHALVDATAQARGEEEIIEEDDDDEGYDLLGHHHEVYQEAEGGEGEDELEGAEDYDMDLAADLDAALKEGAQESEEDEDDEDEDMGGVGMEPVQNRNPELDEAQTAARQQRKKLEEEIEDLNYTMQAKVREFDGLTNATLRARIGKVMETLRGEIDLKMKQMADLGV